MGVRKKFIISVYVGGLYLTTPTREGGAAIAADEPKRLSLVFLREVDGPTVTKAFREGFEANNSKDTLDAVKSRVDLFLAYFEAGVKEDERVDLTYLPGKGTTVSPRRQGGGRHRGGRFHARPSGPSGWGRSPPRKISKRECSASTECRTISSLRSLA